MRFCFAGEGGAFTVAMSRGYSDTIALALRYRFPSASPPVSATHIAPCLGITSSGAALSGV